jgi:hypothetical protein
MQSKQSVQSKQSMQSKQSETSLIEQNLQLLSNKNK